MISPCEANAARAPRTADFVLRRAPERPCPRAGRPASGRGGEIRPDRVRQICGDGRRRSQVGQDRIAGLRRGVDSGVKNGRVVPVLEIAAGEDDAADAAVAQESDAGGRRAKRRSPSGRAGPSRPKSGTSKATDGLGRDTQGGISADGLPPPNGDDAGFSAGVE